MLLLLSCATVAPNATGFSGVPLKPWPAAEQRAALDKVNAACCPVDPVRGSCPVRLACPASAVLERATLDYVELRATVRAAGQP